MSTGAPVEAIWDGEVFRPISPYWVRRADREFAKGEVLRLTNEQERSHKSHAHFFAAVEEAHRNLPPLMAERFPSPDALRKYALVKSGHCYSDSIICPSHADALRVAAFVRASDEFAVIDVKKTVVTRSVPKSQSYQAMSKEEFAASKDDVLRVISEMIGVSKQELSDAGTQPTQRDYSEAG